MEGPGKAAKADRDAEAGDKKRASSLPSIPTSFGNDVVFDFTKSWSWSRLFGDSDSGQADAADLEASQKGEEEVALVDANTQHVEDVRSQEEAEASENSGEEEVAQPGGEAKAEPKAADEATQQEAPGQVDLVAIEKNAKVEVHLALAEEVAEKVHPSPTTVKSNGVLNPSLPNNAAADLVTVMMEAVCETEAAKMDCEGLCDQIASLTKCSQAVNQSNSACDHTTSTNDLATEYRLNCDPELESGERHDSDFGLSERQLHLLLKHQASLCDGDASALPPSCDEANQGTESPAASTRIPLHIPAEIDSLREEVKLLTDRLSYGGGFITRNEFRESVDDFRQNIDLLRERLCDSSGRTTSGDCEPGLHQSAEKLDCVSKPELQEVRREVQALQRDIAKQSLRSDTAALRQDWEQLNSRVDLLTERLDDNDQVTEEMQLRLQEQSLSVGSANADDDIDSSLRLQGSGLCRSERLWSKLEDVEHRIEIAESSERRRTDAGEDSQQRLLEVSERVEHLDAELRDNSENLDWLYSEFESFKKKVRQPSASDGSTQARPPDAQHNVFNRDELLEFKQEHEEKRKKLSGQLADLGKKLVEADLRSRQELASLQEDLQEVRNSQLKALDNLAKQSSTSDVDELRQDVGELAKTLQEVEECLTESTSRLQDEADNIEFLHSEIVKLGSRCDELQGLKCFVEQDVHEVKVRMQELDNASQRSPGDSDYGSQIAQLSRAIQQDQDIEKAARQELQTGMDELCRRLEAMEGGNIGAISLGNVQRLSEAYENLHSMVVANCRQDESSLGWTVLVEREEGGPLLGMQMHHASMLVEEIKPDGLIARWNEDNPDKAVQAGDRLVDVNGQRQARLAVRECQSARSLRITFSRRRAMLKGTARRRSFFLEE